MVSGVNYVEWDDKYKVGIRIIDSQHQHFVGIMNKLFEAIQTDEDGLVLRITEELVDYADKHFAVEEKYFKKFNYPYAKEHTDEHYKIKIKIIKFLSKKDGDPFKTGLKLLDLLDDWLFDHIDKTDRKYIEYFKSHGLS